ALLVLAEGRDLLDVARNVTRFFARESCGKCVPCRVGSEKAVRLLDSLPPEGSAGRGGEQPAGRAADQTRAALEARRAELNEAPRLTSICGLGQVALGPALSLLRNFR